MKKLISYIAGIVLLSSCEKVLDQQPQASLDANTAFATRSAVEAGIIGVYDGLQSASYYGVDFSLLAELGSDNLNHTGSFPSYLEIKNRNIATNNVNISGMWNQMYVVINRVNTVLQSAETISDPAFAKNASIGELRFLRAFVYFDLLRGWGGTPEGYNKPNGKGVPLFLTPTLTAADAAAKPRATEAEVLTQIIADLDFAIANLPVTSASGRVNKNVATGIKARVELYRENFASAETLATQIISQFAAQPRGGLAVDYAGIFANKNTKPESLWELQFTSTDANNLRFYYYGRSEVASSAALGNVHEVGDLRKPVNYTPSGTVFRQIKFFRPDGTDNILILRLAEIYLIRAEARARKAVPDVVGAAADLNIVRSRAGLAITTAITPAALLDAILNERRVELAHEGHRWFDLRRTNRLLTTLG
ncbi:MAG TPA: RagB/SusD family nutrient uptake outer membrane protein, partial [Chitinophagaceae bacterium]|nr:RagB/SusD family nutrient uptake outer membrane protein [Chitinophagaceae bacterium]